MAGKIPQNFINDLLDRIDIVEVINARMTLKRTGKNYSGLCPFHDEKTPSFSVSPDKQFYHCFGCGVSGTALTFLLEHDHLDFVDAVETLAGSIGVQVPREQGGAPRKKPAADLYEIMEAAVKFYRKSLKEAPEAIAYLQERGLTGELARDFCIGYAPDGWSQLKDALAPISESKLEECGLLSKSEKGRCYDRFRHRIMFPIRDTRGRVIGFGGRVLDDSEPKYLNSPETTIFHKGNELYGLYEARRAVRQIDRFVVVEGYMDVVALAQAGVPTSVATLGTASSETHFIKLFRLTSEVVCCFDGDSAGRSAAWKAMDNALKTVTDGRQLKFMFLPDGEDPDSIVRKEGKQGFQDRLKNSMSVADYLFAQLSDGLDLSSLDARARLAELALPKISLLVNGVLKNLMLNRLAEITRLPVSQLDPAAGVVQARAPQKTQSPERGLARQLLTMLLRMPELAQCLAEEDRKAVIATESGLFVSVLAYLVENPEAEIDQILGRWSGEAEHGALLKMAAVPNYLPAEDVKMDFCNGVLRFREEVQRRDRLGIVDRLREGGSTDTLQEYWALKQNEKRSNIPSGPENSPGE